MLVRVRQACCQDACANCAARGAEGLACLHARRCTPPAFQQHGWRCCEWVAAERSGPAAAARPSDAAARQSDAAARHSDEIFRRLRWCIDQGPSHWPAQQHVHRAPGDDSLFALGVAPWGADGSVNAAGIPGTLESAADRPRGSVLLDDEVFGWECRKCATWVSLRPRAFEGGAEPAWWWWCATCRAAQRVGGVGAQESARQRKSALMAAGCKRIEFAPL